MPSGRGQHIAGKHTRKQTLSERFNEGSEEEEVVQSFELGAGTVQVSAPTLGGSTQTARSVCG